MQKSYPWRREKQVSSSRRSLIQTCAENQPTQVLEHLEEAPLVVSTMTPIESIKVSKERSLGPTYAQLLVLRVSPPFSQVY